MYSPFVFSSSVVLAELLYSIMCAVASYFSIYYMPGFQFFIILITEFFSVTLGQTLASITHSPFISTQFNPYLLQSKLLPLTVVRFALISFLIFWR
ncbi:hypothetical protein BFJ63_vAg17106 [Fusarium oxysporum f. sp. narcissi]|uniref:ABC-2 type transporter domain-containing protein n=1 Tax=Fusarium oxysporum f. sp. narcissi TaxID=451672 RepID=A0A4V1RY13_FUSOX|nr:hypothetical protein BFJ63_vAg17106 [Fusarium oxysporum f. sp. narcissi]